MASATKRKPVDFDVLKQEWIDDVTIVVSELEGWLKSHPAHPDVHRTTETIEEEHLGSYEAHGIEATFHAEFKDAITVAPIARNYPGRGFIEILAWPMLRRVYLRQGRERSEWTIYTESNIPLHQDWSEADFHRLINDLRVEL